MSRKIYQRKNCELELMSIHYSLHPRYIDKTKQSIRDIQTHERFENWCNEDVIETILNQNKDE